MPDAQAKPRPDLDNPWSALSILQTGVRPSQTGIFRMPRAEENHVEVDAGEGDAAQPSKDDSDGE